MSFGRLRAAVFDDHAPIGVRYRALREAISRYAFTTRTSFESVCPELGRRHGLLVGALNRPDVLRLAFEDLDRAREHFLAASRAFASDRREAKRRGNRKPSRAAVTQLYESTVLGAPLRS